MFVGQDLLKVVNVKYFIFLKSHFFSSTEYPGCTCRAYDTRKKIVTNNTKFYQKEDSDNTRFAISFHHVGNEFELLECVRWWRKYHLASTFGFFLVLFFGAVPLLTGHARQRVTVPREHFLAWWCISKHPWLSRCGFGRVWGFGSRCKFGHPSEAEGRSRDPRVHVAVAMVVVFGPSF